jgi:hypothetical protein
MPPWGFPESGRNPIGTAPIYSLQAALANVHPLQPAYLDL